MRVPVKQLRKEINQAAFTERDERDSSFELSEEKINTSGKNTLLKKITKGNIIASSDNKAKRKEMIAAKAFEPTEFAYERSIGENDSLYSNFTELIAITKRKVGRIVIIKDNKKIGYATGFMVAKDLLLTNWHVFRDQGYASESEVHFFYEYNADGHPVTPVIFKLDSATFFAADKPLDYAFVAVQPFDITGKIPLESIGYLYLEKGLGKIGEVNKEKLNIIHHPNGDYKQISIRANRFVGIDETKIFYETDTAQGSSGSPVFNDQWQVVGLHHKSVALMSKDGEHFLDKDTEKPIPVIDGRIDVTRVKWMKNEGMRISVIVKHLAETNAGNGYVASLDIPPPKEVLSFGVNNLSSDFGSTGMATNSSQHISISVPVAALGSEKSVDIRLASNKTVVSVDQHTSTDDDTILSSREELLLEIKKEEKEQNIDFSDCWGYDPNFLGVKIPLPKPKKSIEKQIALLKNKTKELKYFKYSVIFNAARKMPLISAVNVEGDASKRLDKSKRKDDWLRDRRIDIEAQLTDKFYAASGFDKGHMGRFEDANWDTTEAKALRNGIYTCFYTNACPQVPGINREGDNLWGKLERAVLEKGVQKEAGRQAKMTVFNGPIFDDSKDRLRKGVMIPMQFYKIILWLNDDDELRATGFKLSQELLVTDDQFVESMMLAEEAIDIDRLVAYKKYQSSIKNLSRLTKIDFSRIEPFDTFRPGVNEEEALLETAEAIML